MPALFFQSIGKGRYKMGITKIERRYINARDKIIDCVLYFASQYKETGIKSDYEKYDFLCMILDTCFDCRVLTIKPKIITIVYECSNPCKAHAIDYVY